MADPFFDPTVPVKNDPLKSGGDEYHNLGAFDYANLDPNAPPVGGNEVPPPPPPETVAHDALISDDGAAKVATGDGVQELPESDPSPSKKPRVNKAKVKKLKNKIINLKVFFWTMIGIWVICMCLFVLIHLNTFGIRIFPL
ncbi:uncharacterized protein CELE_Y71G12B.3 [Caenorhabditis elegans]|uniref:Uncharacterized protein n=1 Tax=Caenorhabditis elegans TaxID=6239 RepID=Q95XM1_CAEEL|nr:Uncharacterized protein CELE_Y71G12B.3 [Caenorhabditis elegans]CCD67991.1 Uncharacterized protein CELE_Y71G12B.3 [Caenorhabditis elegans]|eukprot:NP_490899.2 Uncharacterized protein CELE_Y71G12B.3 [Caenorhabditis elegans]